MNTFSEIDLTHHYNDKCVSILAKWRSVDIDEKNVFLLHENEHELVSHFILDLAQARHKKLESQGVRRQFSNTFLSLAYKCGEGVTEVDYKRFFDSARIKAEKYNRFIGTFAIDISDCLENIYRPAIDRLIEYIKANTKEVRFILIVNTKNNSIYESVYKKVSSRIRRFERIEIFSLEAYQYTDHAINLLSRKGLTVDSSFENILSDYMVKLVERKSFAGFNSVSDFVDDIVYAIHGKKDSTIIPEIVLSDLLDNIVINEDDSIQNRKIGFVGR